MTSAGSWVRYIRYRYASTLLCLFIVLFPTICIYAGYSIGQRYSPRGYRRFPDPGVVVDSTTLNYTWYRSHNLTIDFVGGLGNQMFQYASMYGIARANGLLPIVGETAVVARVFRAIKARRVSETAPGASYAMYLERRSNAFDGRAFSLNFMKNIRLDGFFQSWRYFDHAMSDVRKQFAFSTSTTREADEFLRATLGDYLKQDGAAEIDANSVRFVGVHVRRGDFLDSVNVERGYTVADATFLAKAARYYEGKYRTVIFVVCSDDVEWTRRNFHPMVGMVVYSEFKRAPFHDLCLLSRCNHSIITVGTFGWWGAWLADGETVYYKEYPRYGSELKEEFRMGDYYDRRWIAM